MGERGVVECSVNGGDGEKFCPHFLQPLFENFAEGAITTEAGSSQLSLASTSPYVLVGRGIEKAFNGMNTLDTK